MQSLTGPKSWESFKQQRQDIDYCSAGKDMLIHQPLELPSNDSKDEMLHPILRGLRRDTRWHHNSFGSFDAQRVMDIDIMGSLPLSMLQTCKAWPFNVSSCVAFNLVELLHVRAWPHENQDASAPA